MNFDLILQNFQRGLWTEQMVRVAVNKGIITEEQYNIIIENKPKLFSIKFSYFNRNLRMLF